MSLLGDALRRASRAISKKLRPQRSSPGRSRRVWLSGESLESRTMFAVDFDDQIGEAFNLGAMTANRSRTGQAVETSTDVDMYRFSVTAGQRIAFDVDRPSGSLDSYLRLFNAAGTQLAYNDDGPNPLETRSTQAYLEYTFNTAGTYFVGVSGFGNSRYSATAGTGDANGSKGNYSLHLTRLASAPTTTPTTTTTTTVTTTGDVDDQIREAVSLGAMTQTRTRTGQSISPATDVDMVSFSVTAGQRIAFDVDRPSGSLDSFLRVFDAAGNQLAFNDDGPNPSEARSTEAYLEHTFSTAGTYYVGVSGYGNQLYSAVTGNGDANGSTGAYSLTLSRVQVATSSPPSSSGFRITLAMSGLTASQQTIFNQAAARWSEIIVGDLPDVVFNGQVIDDVLITASSIPIDGVNGVLGQAGPTNLRSGSSLPFRGMMQFDSADMANMEANGTLRDVILHEMGHVLGIGTIWTHRGLISGAGTANPIFTGAQATAAYNQIFGRSESGVPVANVGGAGSRDSHWRESVFGNELLSPTIGGTPNPISRVTVAALADMGYVVNMNAANSFTPLSGITTSGSTSGTTSGAGVFAEVDAHDDHDHDDDDEHSDHVHIASPTTVVGGGLELPPLGDLTPAAQAQVEFLLERLSIASVGNSTAHQVRVDLLMAQLSRSLSDWS